MKKETRGRPRSIIQKKNKKKIKEVVENIFSAIASKHDLKRVENFLSDRFDVSVYAVRMWTTRGIPVALREEVARLAGMSFIELQGMHEVLL